jgi:hypothetical protein
MPSQPGQHKRRWRFYRTVSGHEPVREFLDGLSQEDASEIAVVMKGIATEGLVGARHVRSDLYEARVTGATQIFRILFATEGHFNQVLLALEGFSRRRRKPHRTRSSWR